MDYTQFLTPALVVSAAGFLWKQIDTVRRDLTREIANMDRRLARVEGQLSVLVRPVDSKGAPGH